MPEQLPCINCIVLASCKTRLALLYEKYQDDKPMESIMITFGIILYNSCSLMNTYLWGKTGRKLNSDHLQTFQDFFQGGV